MGWKNLSYWLKGGIILAGINFLLIVLYYLISNGQGSYYDPSAFLYISSFLVTDFFYWGSNSPLEIFIFSSIFYFIIGAIIGLIYGKIKNRKR
jgi:hypothetical protein